MSAFDHLIRSAKQSQQMLADLLRYCEQDLHEDPNSPAMQHWRNVCRSEPDRNAPWIVPRGISLELWSEQPRQLWRFACIQARDVQLKGGVVVLVDPFGEFEELRDELPILDMDATLILRETEPLKLAMALIRLLGRLLVDVVIVAPGVIEQQALSGGNRPMERSPQRAAFLRALRSVSWLCRRRACSLLLLRKIRQGHEPTPLGCNEMRLHLSRKGKNDRLARIEHNGHVRKNEGEWIRW